jgi:hypothetical protein
MSLISSEPVNVYDNEVCHNKFCMRSTYSAAENGHLECLKFSRKNGCKWHPETTYVAAFNGHLKCLQYAHENGCEWDPNATLVAAENGYLECLTYIYEHCGDVATWENIDLEYNLGGFSNKIQDYIDSVREDWKCGLNKPGMMTKSAKRNF